MHAKIDAALRLSARLYRLTIDFVFGDKCDTCSTRGELRTGYYTRAYNSLCEQAAGEHGYYCMNCRTINFDTPNFGEWMTKQPKWIVPYNAELTGRSPEL